MGTNVYSFGENSPLKFTLSDKLAENYNEAVAEYFKAQRRFMQKFGRQWDYANEPIKIGWTKKQQKAWNEFSKVFNKTVERNPVRYHANDIMDDFLVRNVVSAVTRRSTGFNRLITFAAATGVLYGLLRGRKGHA